MTQTCHYPFVIPKFDKIFLVLERNLNKMVLFGKKEKKKSYKNYIYISTGTRLYNSAGNLGVGTASRGVLM